MAPSTKLQFADHTQLINRGDKLLFQKSVQTIEIFWKSIWAATELGKDTSNMAWEQN